MFHFNNEGLKRENEDVIRSIEYTLQAYIWW